MLLELRGVSKRRDHSCMHKRTHHHSAFQDDWTEDIFPLDHCGRHNFKDNAVPDWCSRFEIFRFMLWGIASFVIILNKRSECKEKKVATTIQPHPPRCRLPHLVTFLRNLSAKICFSANLFTARQPFGSLASSSFFLYYLSVLSFIVHLLLQWMDK